MKGLSLASGRRRRPVSALDIVASAVSRVAPRRLRSGIDQLRCDVRAVVDGLSGVREPTFSSPGSLSWEPTPLHEIDPVEHTLPRGLRAGWVTLRTDLGWLARDLRGESRPVLVPRAPKAPSGPNRYETAPAIDAPRALAPRPVRVVDVVRETRDAVTVRLARLDGHPLDFVAGQFLTLHLEVGGRVLRRAYSLSSTPLDGPDATITVKRIAGGVASSFIVDHLSVGDRLDVLGPSGSFGLPALPAAAAARPARTHCVMIAGGSGITPVISILESALRARPEVSVSLIYGNRSEAEIIFRDRLSALATAHGGRLRVQHVLEEPAAGPSDGQTGVLDARCLSGWLDGLPDEVPDGSGEAAQRVYFVCGPRPVMDIARELLRARGVAAEAVHEERFESPSDSVDDARLPAEPVTVHLQVGGRDHLVRVSPGQTLLAAGLAAGAELPFSCAMGGCGACKGQLVSGEVAMEEPNCLTEDERRRGLVLTCCSRPLGHAHVEIA